MMIFNDFLIVKITVCRSADRKELYFTEVSRVLISIQRTVEEVADLDLL